MSCRGSRSSPCCSLRWRRRAQSRTLDIYWVDVEGGAATLLIAPSGESLLVDAGWETGGRDARRIFEVAQQAGLKRIDYFVLSHFHADHEGGLPALAKLIPIGRCFDRGDFIEPANQRWRDAYLGVCGDRRTIVKVGDRVPLKGVQVDIVASDGQLLAKPMNGGRPNPLCATAENKPRDVPENYRMVGALFTFGKFRFLDLADLDWAMEMELACPVNKLGEVTLYQTGRHGALDGAGAPGFLYAIKPQVVIVNNGPRKGLGGPSPGQEKAATVALRADCEVAGHRRDLAGAPLAVRQGTQHQRNDDREPRGHRGVPGALDQGVGRNRTGSSRSPTAGTVSGGPIRRAESRAVAGPASQAGQPVAAATSIDREYRRHRRSVFAGIFAGYAAYYLVRNNLALAIPDILARVPAALEGRARLGADRRCRWPTASRSS